MIQQTQQQKQLLKFSPLQIQMLNLLHLSTHELEQKIKDEIEENPALEESVNDEDEFEPTSPEDSAESEIVNEDREDFNEFYEEYDEDIPNYKVQSDNDFTDEEHYSIPVIQNDSFHEKIKLQMDLQALSEHERDMAHFLIDSLDDDGYLRSNLEELAYQYSFSNGKMTEVEELEQILGRVQNCEPPGIGARNLQECLLLQLNRTKKNEPYYQTACRMLQNHIFELENRNFEKIMRSMNIDSEDLKAAVKLISKLSPKPNIFTDETTHNNQVMPEYTVRNEEGYLYVSLINKNLPELRLSKNVVKMVEESEENKEPKKKRDRAAVTFFKNKVNSAKWFIDAIKQREDTMLKVMKAIAQFQYDFFTTGDYKKLKPMILKNIAEVVGMDISTISRVTSTKYVQTDFGTILLKELFTEAMSKENGDVVSNKEIQDIIKELLEAEDKSEPLTDQEISEKLKERGYTLARRTVAKYRECLDIPIAKMRKCFV